MFCYYTISKDNCSDYSGSGYKFAFTETEFSRYVNPIKNNPLKGKVIEEEISEPPCANKDIIKKFKISNICNFIQKINEYKEAFLLLMKFTKQTPVYLEEEDEYNTIFQNANLTLQSFGYTYRKEKVKYIIYVLHTYSINLTII